MNLIFGYPRTGSTTLLNALQLLKNVQGCFEPYHRGYSITFAQYDVNYRKIAKNKGMLKSIDELFTRYNLIKHNDGVLSSKNTSLLIQKHKAIVFLQRKSLLRCVLSGEIANQSNLWMRADSNTTNYDMFNAYRKLRKFNIRTLKNRIAVLKKTANHWEAVAIKHKVPYKIVYFEDLFEENDFQLRIKRFLDIADFFQFEPECDVKKLLNLLGDGGRQGSSCDYLFIPNLKEIIEELSNEENGILRI